MDADLDGERVIVDANAVEERDPAELGLGVALRVCEPSTEYAAPRQVPDPPHLRLPQPLLVLVEVRRCEHPACRSGAPVPAAEQCALLHDAEHPVPHAQVVPVEQGGEFGSRNAGEVAGNRCGAPAGGRRGGHGFHRSLRCPEEIKRGRRGRTVGVVAVRSGDETPEQLRS
jgi:hypothetical protein